MFCFKCRRIWYPKKHNQTDPTAGSIHLLASPEQLECMLNVAQSQTASTICTCKKLLCLDSVGWVYPQQHRLHEKSSHKTEKKRKSFTLLWVCKVKIHVKLIVRMRGDIETKILCACVSAGKRFDVDLWNDGMKATHFRFSYSLCDRCVSNQNERLLTGIWTWCFLARP